MIRCVPALAATMTLVAFAAGHAAAQSAAAQPTVAMRSVRLTASDVARTAAFYDRVFGMKEVQRYERPASLEIVMNFGATTDQAKANTGARLIIITPPEGAAPDLASHMVLNVTGIEALAARVTANGGTLERAPAKSTTSDRIIAMVKDPAGNRVELIQEP